MRHKGPFFTLIALLISLLVGCYSFTATSLPAHIRTISINEVENLTNDPLLALRLHDAVVELLRKNASSIRIVDQDADAEFAITLANYSNVADNYTGKSDVETYKATLTVNVVFRDRTKDEIIYQGMGLRAEGIYDITKNESEERHGQQRAIEKLQDLIINNALAKW